MLERLAAGDIDLATTAGEEAVDVAAGQDSSVVSAALGWAFGATLVEHGQPQRARELILDLVGGPDAQRLAVTERCLAWLVLTQAAVQLDRPEEAAEWATRCTELATCLDGIALPGAYAARARAAAALACGRSEDAATAALEAVDAAESASARVDAALARLDAGRALAAAGQRERAVAILEAARAAFAGYGAPRWHDAATRELRRLGQRAGRGGRRGSGQRGVASLSQRELEIATLVSQGKTNKQIAAELFLAERTIETHLSNIFRKLGTPGRAAVGTALERDRRNSPQHE